MVLESILAIAGIMLAGWLIRKKVSATISLFAGGLLILMVAPLLGHTDTGTFSITDTGNAWLNQFGYIGAILARTTSGIGMVIMVLFGFSAYMTHIGANQMATSLLLRPLLRLKLKYLLIPVVFWVGNLMSLAVPSASALAVLLVATVLPAMVGAGINPITAAAVIATTATIMPTPLGADNVVASDLLGIPLDEYVFGMHAVISIPTLVVMGVVHYFWQRFMDKRTAARKGEFGTLDIIVGPQTDLPGEGLGVPAWYAVMPILPLLFVLIPFLLRQFTPLDITAELIPVTLISVLITVVAELIRKRILRDTLEDIMAFFKGMGTGFGVVVALVVAANVLVEGMIQIGIVSWMSEAVATMDNAALILFLGFSGAMLLLALLTGGLAPFYSLVQATPEVVAQTGINGALLTLPMQFIGNLARAMSPVAAVVLIVSSAVKVSVGQLIARTAIPMAVGIVMSMILTWFVVGA